MKNNLLSIDEYRNNSEFYFCKGLRSANKRNLNDAYKNLVKALELEPDNPEYKFNIACFLSEMQRPREANRIFSDILLNYDPTMYDCYFGLGCNSFEIGDTEKAAEYFDKYLYFDGDGEFNEEVSEMLFYLKLYNDISYDNKFIKLSRSSLKRAQKSLKENNTKNAVRELYKSVNSNPFNIEAKNLLTLVLMEQRQYNRAEYLNSTVLSFYDDDVWANCLCLYSLFYARKYSRVNKFLEILPFRNINSREDLLCAATTLFIFNKTEAFTILLETYIMEYSDSLVYSMLLLGYVLLQKFEKADEVVGILYSMKKANHGLMEWLEYIKKCLSSSVNEISSVSEYEKIFELNNEAIDYKYHPYIYLKVFDKKQDARPKLSKKYMPIIECAVQHREIMYNRYYEKEIILVLNNCLKETKEQLDAGNGGTAAYSAALEYIYCRENYIEMKKQELIKKYNISSIEFNSALKKLNV